MKLVGIISTAVLLLLLGTAAPAYAQREEHAQQGQQARSTQHARQEKQAKAPQHAQQRQQARPPQQARQGQQARSSQPGRPGQQVRSSQQAQQRQQARPRQRAQYAMTSQQSERYGNRGGRIPEIRFREHFGRGHMFRIDRPYVVGGYSRFQYGGFWFGLYDPWPAGWYYTDDVYVDSYGGQYFLYNRMHPGARLVINVVL
jgi:hypothetical protein